MADPTKTSDKLHEVENDSEGQLLLFSGPPPLVFNCHPRDGRPPYEVDLTEFAEGHRYEGPKSWAGDFSGRPVLAAEIALAWRSKWGSSSEQSVRGRLAALRAFWRCLDDTPGGKQVKSVADLDGTHGAIYKLWHAENGYDDGVYRIVQTIICEAVRCRQLPDPLWPTLKRSAPETTNEDVSAEIVRRIYDALVTEAKGILNNFAEGERLAAEGEDPRAIRFGRGIGRSQAGWQFRENHAWLIRELCGTTILSKREIQAAGGRGLNQANRPEQIHLGASHLAPGHSSRASEGIVGKLRWLYPSFNDTAVFLLLFLIGTGWNLATALNLDISQPEDKGWCEPNPEKPGWVDIFALKPRSAFIQHASSETQKEFRPHWIIQTMKAWTAGLRRRLETEIAEFDEKLQRNPGDVFLLRERSLRVMHAKSPWLIHWLHKIGKVTAITDRSNDLINDVLRLTIDRHDIRGKNGELVKVTTSDFRDTWAAHVFGESGFNLIVTQLALGHANRKTMQDYLNSRRWAKYSSKRFRRFQEALMQEVRERRLVDGAVLRILVENGTITDAQRGRLLDYRKRTRVGMGCLDPFNPPPEIAPHHKSGGHCRVQTCSLCSHGWVFEDSLEGLAMRYAELILIQERVPLQTWEESGWHDEKIATELALELLQDQGAVHGAVARWVKKLRDGESPVFDHVGIHGGVA